MTTRSLPLVVLTPAVTIVRPSICRALAPYRRLFRLRRGRWLRFLGAPAPASKLTFQLCLELIVGYITPSLFLLSTLRLSTLRLTALRCELDRLLILR